MHEEIKKINAKGPNLFNLVEQPRPCNWNGIRQRRQTPVNDANFN